VITGIGAIGVRKLTDREYPFVPASFWKFNGPSDLTDRKAFSGSNRYPVEVAPKGPPTDREGFLYNAGRLPGR